MTDTAFTDEQGKGSQIKEKKFGFALIVSVVILSLLAGSLGGVSMVYYLQQNGKSVEVPAVVTKKEKIILEESSAFIDVSKEVKPAVVSITTTKSVADFFGDFFQQKGGGTGFILTSDGLIATNKHVVSGGDSFSVFTSDGKEYKAEVKATDPVQDLAILKIEATGLPVVKLGDSESLEVGQWVVAIGNALGVLQNSVTTGVISAKDRKVQAGDSAGQEVEQLEGLLQTDAAINSGNSGGPLVNLKGEVIGINTAVAAKGTAEGIGFAIPINTVKSAIESVKKQGKIVRPFLGVTYIPVTKELAQKANLNVDYGALVYRSNNVGSMAVSSGSPAEKAGIVENDIITELNGERIDENHSLTNLIQQYQPGDEIELTYYHQGEQKKVKLQLGEFKS